MGAVAHARERGFALLVVLWSLVLIALLTTQILASGRSALHLAGNLRDAAQARALLDGAINEALWHELSAGTGHWAPDGTPHALRGITVGGITVGGITVRVTSVASKINPNLASTGLLAGLFHACGAGSGQALQIANAIIAWRSPAISQAAAQALQAQYKQAGLPFGPPYRNFADLAELGDVMGMTPALLAAAMPHMDIYQSGDPDPSLADPIVRQALFLAGQTGSSASVYSGADLVVAIEAQAGGLHRRAIVSITGAGRFQYLALTDYR
jgi:general secretion pathway protein K